MRLVHKAYSLRLKASDFGFCPLSIDRLIINYIILRFIFAITDFYFLQVLVRKIESLKEELVGDLQLHLCRNIPAMLPMLLLKKIGSHLLMILCASSII